MPTYTYFMPIICDGPLKKLVFDLEKKCVLCKLIYVNKEWDVYLFVESPKYSV